MLLFEILQQSVGRELYKPNPLITIEYLELLTYIKFDYEPIDID